MYRCPVRPWRGPCTQQRPRTHRPQEASVLFFAVTLEAMVAFCSDQPLRDLTRPSVPLSETFETHFLSSIPSVCFFFPD